jgi:hypothetical protein
MLTCNLCPYGRNCKETKQAMYIDCEPGYVCSYGSQEMSKCPAGYSCPLNTGY